MACLARTRRAMRAVLQSPVQEDACAARQWHVLIACALCSPVVALVISGHVLCVLLSTKSERKVFALLR